MSDLLGNSSESKTIEEIRRASESGHGGSIVFDIPEADLRLLEEEDHDEEAETETSKSRSTDSSSSSSSTTSSSSQAPSKSKKHGKCVIS
jgi:hypothetical protein